VGRMPQQPVLSPAKKIRPDRCGAATPKPVPANAPTASNQSTSRMGGGCKVQWTQGREGADRLADHHEHPQAGLCCAGSPGVDRWQGPSCAGLSAQPLPHRPRRGRTRPRLGRAARQRQCRRPRTGHHLAVAAQSLRRPTTWAGDRPWERAAPQLDPGHDSGARRRRPRGHGPVASTGSAINARSTGSANSAATLALGRNGDGGAGVPLSVDGQVLLVHNRTRPRPYRPQGLAIDPNGAGSPASMALATTPGTEGEDASGVVAHSDVHAVPDGTGQGGAAAPSIMTAWWLRARGRR
jgi:hypothetical protein